LIYIDRFFKTFGSPETPEELYRRLHPPELTAYLVDYAMDHGPGSREWMHRVLRNFLRFSFQSGFMSRDLSVLVLPLRRRTDARLPRSLPEKCIVALDASIHRETAAGLRDSAIVGLLKTYGVRGIQVRRLCLEHLDWERSRIHFPAVKGGTELKLPLTAETGNRLADYLTAGRPKTDCREVFLSLVKPFGPLKRAGQISGMIRRRLRQAGIDPPEGVSRGSHGFRHAFASRLIGRIPFKDLVDLLGHRDPSSTLIYGKVDLPHLLKASLPLQGGCP